MFDPMPNPPQPKSDAFVVGYAACEALFFSPDHMTPTPDPSKLIEALNDLAQKVDKLLALVPQLSVPILVRGLIDALIHQLNDIPVYGWEAEGKRFDTGTPEGYKEAVAVMG